MLDYIDHMLRFRKQYYRALEPCCRKWNLTHNEMDVILFLRNHPLLDRASDIVSRRGIAKSHVSQSVADLEARGLLRKQPDPVDRRTLHLHLTAAADPLCTEACAAQQEFFRVLCAGLTREDQQAWNTVLQKLLSAIQQMEQNQ